MPSVLFVCTANVCRSPMAMALFRSMVKPDTASWRIESAGTWALDGEPAHQKTRQVMSERGLDLGDHYSRTTTRELLQPFNLILTMERGQKEALQIEFPELAERIYLITEMIGSTYNVADPVGGPIEDFRISADEMERILTDGFDQIVRLSAG